MAQCGDDTTEHAPKEPQNAPLDDIDEILRDLPPSANLIFKTLKDDGSVTFNELLEETHLAERTARHALKNLKEESLVDSYPSPEDRRKMCYRVKKPNRRRMKRRDTETMVSVHQAEHCVEKFQANDASIVLLEAGDGYEWGHIPGAVPFPVQSGNARQQSLCDPSTFEAVAGRRGISRETTVVIYSPEANLKAAYLYWLFTYFRQPDVRLIEGGKSAWREAGYDLVTEPATVTERDYTVPATDEETRAYRAEISEAIATDVTLLDVRDEEEYTGDACGYSDRSVQTERVGHIPEAVNLPWTELLTGEGTIKERAELVDVLRDYGVFPRDRIIAYCHDGLRAAYVWIILTELLDYPEVSVYDGSWIEWGNLVDAPVSQEV